MDLLPHADASLAYYTGTHHKHANMRVVDTPARLKGSDQSHIHKYSVHAPTNYRVQQHLGSKE